MNSNSRRHSQRRLALGPLAIVGILALAPDLLDVAGVLYHKHGHYRAEEWFGSYAVVGLVAALLAIAAGWLGHLLHPRRKMDDA